MDELFQTCFGFFLAVGCIMSVETSADEHAGSSAVAENHRINKINKRNIATDEEPLRNITVVKIINFLELNDCTKDDNPLSCWEKFPKNASDLFSLLSADKSYSTPKILPVNLTTELIVAYCSEMENKEACLEMMGNKLESYQNLSGSNDETFKENENKFMNKILTKIKEQMENKNKEFIKRDVDDLSPDVRDYNPLNVKNPSIDKSSRVIHESNDYDLENDKSKKSINKREISNCTMNGNSKLCIQSISSDVLTPIGRIRMVSQSAYETNWNITKEFFPSEQISKHFFNFVSPDDTKLMESTDTRFQQEHNVPFTFPHEFSMSQVPHLNFHASFPQLNEVQESFSELPEKDTINGSPSPFLTDYSSFFKHKDSPSIFPPLFQEHSSSNIQIPSIFSNHLKNPTLTFNTKFDKHSSFDLDKPNFPDNQKPHYQFSYLTPNFPMFTESELTIDSNQNPIVSINAMPPNQWLSNLLQRFIPNNSRSFRKHLKFNPIYPSAKFDPFYPSGFVPIKPFNKLSNFPFNINSRLNKKRSIEKDSHPNAFIKNYKLSS